MSSNQETRGITARIIIEVIGKPAEYVAETLSKIVESLGKEKGVSIVDSKVNDPISLKENPDFYTTFAEVEIEVETISHIAGIMFKYMPAHVEIISPSFIALSNSGWNDVFNELVRKLHGYDEIARVTQVEKSILEKKLKTLLESQKGKKDSKEKED